jgi:hypothetical protein
MAIFFMHLTLMWSVPRKSQAAQVLQNNIEFSSMGAGTMSDLTRIPNCRHLICEYEPAHVRGAPAVLRLGVRLRRRRPLTNCYHVSPLFRRRKLLPVLQTCFSFGVSNDKSPNRFHRITMIPRHISMRPPPEVIVDHLYPFPIYTDSPNHQFPSFWNDLSPIGCISISHLSYRSFLVFTTATSRVSATPNRDRSAYKTPFTPFGPSLDPEALL